MGDLARRADIQTCRDHHAVLRGLIDATPDAEPFEPSAAAAALARLRLVLLRHLELEDSWLYPALEKLDQPEVAATARRYREEMGGLSVAFVAFAERWTSADQIAGASERFVGDWATVRTALLRRIDAEDDHLYELAERVLKV